MISPQIFTACFRSSACKTGADPHTEGIRSGVTADTVGERIVVDLLSRKCLFRHLHPACRILLVREASRNADANLQPALSEFLCDLLHLLKLALPAVSAAAHIGKGLKLLPSDDEKRLDAQYRSDAAAVELTLPPRFKY